MTYPVSLSGGGGLKTNGTFAVQIAAGGSSYFNGGNVGIGTTGPAQGKLVVQNSDDATSVVDQTPGTIAVMNSDLTAGNFSLITFNEGQSAVATAGMGTWNTTHSPASTLSTGDLALFTKPSGASTLSERMRVTSSGNVGIGTTSPNLGGDRRALTVSAGTSGDYIARLEVQGTRTADNIYGALDFYHKANNTASIESYRSGADDAGNLTFWTRTTGMPLAERMRIDNSGNVGIGTDGPSALFDVKGGGTNAVVDVMKVTGDATSPVFRVFRDTPKVDATLALTVLRNGAVGIGTSTPTTKLEVAGSVKVTGSGNSISTPVLSITGGADVAEPFTMSGGDIPKGAVVVIDEAHPGRLKLSQRAYDERVAGIVSGAGGVNPGITLSQQGVLEGDQNVAISGRVYVQADATGSPIKPGDLLTTSDVPGHAMRATDRARAQGAILGKAMSSLPTGRGLVLVLVSLQ